MPITIGSNISSLKAQRQLSEGTSQLSKTYERLSSGQRINKAADDAAGLAISESLKSDKRVFNQGVRNFNDGISLLNIADGAVENLTNIVVRLKELAEQSANGTYSATQRKAIDKEAQALSKEYTRIAQSTKFNGVHLLNGSLGNGVRLQGGFGTDGSIFSGIGGAIGNGTFGNRTTAQAGDAPHSIINGDFNGDGFLDIASGSYNDNSINLLIGNGNGTFQARTSILSGDVYSISSSDLNNDGILDLVSADFTDNRVSVFIGNGNGTFQTRVSYQVGSGPQSVGIGDFNGDGNLDLVSADTTDSRVSVLLGTGTGTFSARSSYQVGAGARTVQVADFNGDGYSDIVTADITDDKISILLANGNGTFQTRVSYQAGDGPRGINTKDFNADGIMDIVTADISDNRVSVFLGNGNGTFQSRQSFLTGSGPRGIESGDFNGDGILDIATADLNDSKASILLGTGNGSFSSPISYQIGSSPYALNAGDFNSDGVLDLISADLGDDSFSIILGTIKDGVSPIHSFDLTTISGSRQALPVFDQKIQQLAKQRGTIGAFQSRVQVGINNLQSASENYAAAESRIRDADIAHESSQLVRLNILQQAASSVLGQANLQPQLALSLLRN